MPFAWLLKWMADYADDAPDWQKFTEAQLRLAARCATPDEHTFGTVQGDDWRIDLGDINVQAPAIGLHKGESLLAVIQKSNAGRLRVTAWQPLDGRSLSMLLAMARKPDPVHGVCMRENNWEYALDCSAANGQIYAANAGKSYLALWQYGLGIKADGSVDESCHSNSFKKPIRPYLVAAMLGIYWSLSPG